MSLLLECNKKFYGENKALSYIYKIPGKTYSVSYHINVFQEQKYIGNDILVKLLEVSCHSTNELF